MWCKDWVDIQQRYLRSCGSKCCSRLWLVNLLLLIQNMMHSLWITRNDAIHRIEDSAQNQREHTTTNEEIDRVFSSLPNLRLLPPSDAAFFKRGRQRIQSYRLQRKKKWVSDATAILESFRRSLNANSANFLDFFTNT